MKRILPLLILLFFLAGCSISINTKKANDLGVYKSVDSGETWAQYVSAGRVNKKEIQIGDLRVLKIIPNPDDKQILYIITAGRGIYKSENGGEIWQETGLKSGTYVNVDFDAKNKNILYTATDGRILKSTNAGKNWQAIYIETQPGQVITDVATDHYDDKRIYAATNKGTLIKSDDYGITWQVLKWFNKTIKSIRINPHDSRIIYLITDGQGLIKSTDKGESWTFLEDMFKKYKGSARINAFCFNHNNPSEYYLATDYGILKTDGVSEESLIEVKTLISFGNKIDQVALDPSNAGTIYFTKDNKFHISNNFGENWKTILLPTSGWVSDILVIPGLEENTIYLTINKTTK